MLDRASVNDAAMRIVTVVYPNILDVGCFAHLVAAIDLVAATVALLWKLLNGYCHELLQTFCTDFSTSYFTLRRSSRLATSTQPYLLADTVVYNWLDIFQWSFLGSITKIWQNEVPICLCHLLDDKLCAKTFSMLYVGCRVCNGHVVFIVKKAIARGGHFS